MAVTIAFDVYGTLIDTAGVTGALEPHAGRLAGAFSSLWRQKQLEYSFRRAVMHTYRDFSVCTRQALDYACRYFRLEMTEADRESLMGAYRRLPAFPDAGEAISRLRNGGFRLFAFSNGVESDVRGLLQTAGIGDHFEDVVSVDDVRSFKPDPEVYAHFLRRAGVSGPDAWMVSANPFDVLGAASAGMPTVWVRRTADLDFDPWETDPTATVDSLTELPEVLAR